MTPLTNFLPRLLPRVAGCPEPVAMQALLDSAIQFCHRSLAVREQLGPVDTVAGLADYALDVPPRTVVAQVLAVSLNGAPLEPLAQEHSALLLMGGYVGGPRYSVARRVDELLVLTLAPAPQDSETAALVATVALAPARNADRVPDDLYERWIDPVLDGAQAALARIPGETYFDPKIAAALSTLATAAADAARVDAMHGQQQTSLRVQPRRF